MNIPQIDTGKKPNEYLHISHMWLLPADTPFGNMALKHMKIVQTVDHVNLKLQFLFRDWHALGIGQPRTNFDPLAYKDPLLHLLYIEEFIYFVRRIADDLISIAFLLYQFISTGQYPTRLEIDSIGSLFDTKNHADFKARLSDSETFLEVLNDISNAYKHSFINSDQSIIGQLEPCAPALALKRNNLQKNQPRPYIVAVSHIVSDFNKFYLLIKSFILECNPGHQTA